MENSGEWISFKEAQPPPNSRIAVKGFKRDLPGEEFISPNVYVDEDGIFATSVEIQDTHWKLIRPRSHPQPLPSLE